MTRGFASMSNMAKLAGGGNPLSGMIPRGPQAAPPAAAPSQGAQTREKNDFKCIDFLLL